MFTLDLNPQRAKTKVVWFKNPHEHRNYPLRFGLMRLHRQNRLRYSERPLADCTAFGFPAEVAAHTHRHTSAIAVMQGNKRITCVIDSEDSFYWMSPLIKSCDLYFCAGYNAALFEGRTFPQPYGWQKDFEVAFYKDRARHLIEEFGPLFSRVRRFVPIGPNAMRRTSVPYLTQRFRNLHHKLRKPLSEEHPWFFELLNFETRYRQLLSYRSLPLAYDVVLLDTLWGWPRHRVNLHLKLKELSGRRTIHSRLNWSDPVACDGGTQYALDKEHFPIACGAVDDYERMLAMSRMGVFATGFHWGWRNIMTLALMVGIPVHTDRLLVEPWFDMTRFKISFNDATEWPDIERHLAQIDEAEWHKIRTHNQNTFDELLAPEKVAQYFIETALQELSPAASANLASSSTQVLAMNG